MKMTKKTPLAAALGTAVISTFASNSVNAESNPFVMSELSAGYMQMAQSDTASEMKCGANMSKTSEGSCGEGKCGEGKCAGNKAKTNVQKNWTVKKYNAKATEAACGEGKCGAMMDGDKMKKGMENVCGAMMKGKEGACGDMGMEAMMEKMKSGEMSCGAMMEKMKSGEMSCGAMMEKMKMDKGS